MANQSNPPLAALILDLVILIGLAPVFGKQSDNATPDEIPFELREGHRVIAKGSLPGLSTELNLLIDTGATATFVDRRLARRAGLRKLPDMGISSTAFGHGLKVERVILRDLQLGRRVITRSCLATDLPWKGVDIVVGLDILRGLPLTIDYENSKVVFGGQPSTRQAALLEDEQGLLVVPVTIKGHTLRLAVDTGAHLSIVYADRARDWDKRTMGEKWVEVAHSGGSMPGRQITLPTVQIQTIELSRVPVVVLQTESCSSGIDGFLGTASLDVRQVQLDFQNQALYLVRK